jgi:hypothetical protein
LKASRKTLVGVAVFVTAIAAVYVTARVLVRKKTTQVDLKMSGSECRNKVKHKKLDCDTGDKVEWEVRNYCTDKSAHEVEVSFVNDPCALGSVLQDIAPADGGTTITTLSCIVEYNPGVNNQEDREYHVIGDAKEDDPDIVIRGKEGFLWRLKILLARLLSFLG